VVDVAGAVEVVFGCWKFEVFVEEVGCEFEDFS
jgi:hypothetical protein